MELARDSVLCGGCAALTGDAGMCNDAEAPLKLLIKVGDPYRGGVEATKIGSFTCGCRTVLVVFVLGGAD